MKFLSTQAGGYAALIIVGVVGFVVVHAILKKDVKDAADTVKHPLGQGFDDMVQGWVDRLTGNTNSQNSDSLSQRDPNFGLTDPNSNTWN